MTIPSAQRETVAKLLGLIGSAHDAEALAAARKAQAILQSHKTTWHQLLNLNIEAIEVATPSPEPAHRAEVQDLLTRGRGILTEWERSFLIGILSFTILQPAQVSTLDNIRAKINASHHMRKT